LITHIDDQGFLWFRPIGGWDDQVLTGQRVRVTGQAGITTGVIGRSPIHLLGEEERGRAAKIKDLWIDIGAKDGDEARERVAVGNVAVIEQPPVELRNNRLIARGIDNRVGSYVALETLRLIAADRPAADVYAVAATQEEITRLGARTSTYALNPAVAIVVGSRTPLMRPGLTSEGKAIIVAGEGQCWLVGPRSIRSSSTDWAKRHGRTTSLTAWRPLRVKP
jgi:endoglucanase